MAELEANMVQEIEPPRTVSEQADPELPPGLPSPTARSTKSSDVASPPPGLESLEPTDLLNPFMPKKIPVQAGRLEHVHNFHSEVGHMTPLSPNGEATKKKFCAFCGMQVDPQYLTAKFCAYCGVEHVQMGDGNTNEVVEPARAVVPSVPILSTKPQAGDLQYKYDSALYDDGTGLSWLGYHGITDADYYTDTASFAWRGMNMLVPDNLEYGDAFLEDRYASSYPLSGTLAASWPSQAMAW